MQYFQFQGGAKATNSLLLGKLFRLSNRMVFFALLWLAVPNQSFAQANLDSLPIKQQVLLNVPLVKQHPMLCGPATIEMLFRYWGVERYNQYDIARNILYLFPDTPRVVKSGILNSRPLNWEKYPGTGTSTMAKFLRKFSKTYNSLVEHLPLSGEAQLETQSKHFQRLKKNLSNGVPVIVHQRSRTKMKGGHYRLVVGYDEGKKIVYLNDASPGKRITQTYENFLADWNVNERWLHYNALAFNFEKQPIVIQLPY